jgi:hypothetical protein
MRFSVGQSGEMRPTSRLDLHLSIEELIELVNTGRDCLHQAPGVWPLGTRFHLQVPNHEPLGPRYCERCGMSRTAECDELGH